MLRRKALWIALGVGGVALAVTVGISHVRNLARNPRANDPALLAAIDHVERRWTAPEPPPPNLATAEVLLETAMSPAALRRLVVRLAGEIGERNLGRPQSLARAADFIDEQLAADFPDRSRERYAVEGLEVSNLLFEKNGSKELPWLVIGAHYDSARGTPGADDNASGVAALIELARHLARKPVRHPLRFVAFTQEEPPYFRTPQMGSHVHAERMKARGERVSLMLSLEMVGYYSDDRRQKYPSPVMPFVYPATADFIGVVGNTHSREVAHTFHALLRAACPVDSQVLVAPESVRGVDFSDHQAFWQRGYPALMITDTAFYRNPHYHRSTDIPDTLDYERMSQVVIGLAKAIEAFDSIGAPED